MEMSAVIFRYMVKDAYLSHVSVVPILCAAVLRQHLKTSNIHFSWIKCWNNIVGKEKEISTCYVTQGFSATNPPKKPRVILWCCSCNVSDGEETGESDEWLGVQLSKKHPFSSLPLSSLTGTLSRCLLNAFNHSSSSSVSRTAPLHLAPLDSLWDHHL